MCSIYSIVGDSVIACDKIIQVTKTIPTKSTSSKTVPTSFNDKKVTHKIEDFYILLAFLLITVSLFIMHSIT